MPLFRCLSETCPAGGDFEAAAPVCPHCNANGKKNPMLICEVATVHYLVSDPDGPIQTPLGGRRVACMPNRARLTPHATGERSAVTCPKCKACDVYAGHEKAGVEQHVPVIEAAISRQAGMQVSQG